MPRRTYKDRFEELLAKDYIASRDRQFLESLYMYYESNRTLTSGRRRHFLRMENQYRNPPTITTEDAELIEELDKLQLKLDQLFPGDRSSNQILGSFGQQLRAGKSLSPKQIAIVEKKRDDCSDKNIKQAQQWKDTWNPEKEEIFNICVEYYSKNGYYARLINKVQSTNGYIPSFGEYKKLTENKYARGILRGWYGNAKYEPGALVVASSAGSWSARHIKLGMILSSNPKRPISYGKGNKIYHVIDLPTNKKYFLEERHLKFAKLPKKKTK